MQLYKNVVNPTNITPILLIVVIFKTLVFGMVIAEAIAIVALAAIFALNIYLNRQDTEWKEKTETEITEMKATIESLHGQLNIVRTQMGVKKSNEQATAKDFIRRF